MPIETFISIVLFAVCVIAQIIMRWSEKNVYLTYKEQKVGVKK